ncbi:MAG: hypothetical protein ABFD64_01385 [Armatimonadota bacterium]
MLTVLVSHIRWYTFLVATAVIVSWITAGDCIVSRLNVPAGLLKGPEFDKYLLWGMTATALSYVGWLLIQNQRWGTESIRRWQTYIGILIALAGAIPACTILQNIAQLNQGLSALVIALTIAGIIAKIVIIGYWATIMLPAVYRRLH